MKIYITGLPSGYEVEHLVPMTCCGAWTGIRPPWGKMTGVRPVRLVHDKRAAGWTEDEIDGFFLKRFDCSRQKYDMAKAIADLQEPILKLGSAPKTYSLYIGIPFCPSRCSYCSFVSCNLDRDRKLVQPYVDCLCREVEAIRGEADKAGLKLCSIYIGGGTPTSLSAAQLRQLMGTVRENFDLSQVVEYTVEAGRPGLHRCRKAGRHQGVRCHPHLHQPADLLGRGAGRHWPQALGSGHPRLLCRGPGRRPRRHQHGPHRGPARRYGRGFEHSLRQAIALDPENITVHTLTLKRASRIVMEDQKENDYADVAAMLEKCHLLADAGYRPYYLYRQKNTLQNWKMWAGASRATRGTIISISWKKSRPSSRPEQAAAPSWWPTAASGCSASSISSIRQNTSSVSTKCWSAKKEWRFFMITIWVPKRLVEVGLYNVAARSPAELAALSEQSYRDRVKYAAEKVRFSGTKIVMLTGPSASGKTTRAHKLAEELIRQGTYAHVVSLDNFFRGAEFYPRLPDGTLDYENPDTMDMPLVRQCLRELSETGRTTLPIYDFANERRSNETEAVDLQGGVCIVEGIHALNPELTGLVQGTTSTASMPVCGRNMPLMAAV